MKLTVKLLGFSFLILVMVSSCRKDKPIDPPDPPNPPTDTLITYPISAPPASITFEDRAGSVNNIKFDYATQGVVNVTLNDQPAVHYVYNDGYLQEMETFNAAGKLSKLIVERSGTSITRVIVEHIDQLTSVSSKDTMAVSFGQSAGNTTLTVNGKYFTNTPITVGYTYQDNLLKEIRGGDFSGASNVFLPSYQFTYDNQKRLSLKTSNTYYGTSYVYGDAGSGLDSLFKVLGGKDGHFLEGILFYDEYVKVFFHPLHLILGDAGIELEASIHRWGPLREVRSVPFGADYPEVRVFNVQNTYNDAKQVTTSRVTRGADYVGSYTFAY